MANDDRISVEMEALNQLGLNTVAALSNFGDNANKYKEVLLTLCRSSDTKSRMLNHYVGQHDCRNYITIIHGILGVAQMIGAEELADKSRELERVAKQEKYEELEAETSVFGEQYDTLLSAVRDVIMTKDEMVTKGVIEKEDLLTAIGELRYYLEDFRISEIEELLFTLGQLSYQDTETMELIHAAEEQMMDYNYDGVVGILDKIESALTAE